jgi:hypothetical protein
MLRMVVRAWWSWGWWLALGFREGYMGWICVNERGYMCRTRERMAHQKTTSAHRVYEILKANGSLRGLIRDLREEERQRQRKNTIVRVDHSTIHVPGIDAHGTIAESTPNATSSLPKTWLERGELTFGLSKCRFWFAQEEPRTDGVR